MGATPRASASRLAVETIANHFQTTQDDRADWPYKMDRGHRFQTNRLVSAIKLANLKIYEEAERTATARHGNHGGFRPVAGGALLIGTWG